MRVEKPSVVDQESADFFDIFKTLNSCSRRRIAFCAALRSNREGDRRRHHESCNNYESFELAIAKNLHGTLPICELRFPQTSPL